MSGSFPDEFWKTESRFFSFVIPARWDKNGFQILSPGEGCSAVSESGLFEGFLQGFWKMEGKRAPGM
jgi:hypothetical protein